MAGRRRSTGWRVPPFVGVSFLVHGLGLLILTTTDAGRGCGSMRDAAGGPGLAPVASLGGGNATATAELPDDIDLACFLDQVLAGAARMTFCAVPGFEPYGSCAGEVFALDLLATACRVTPPPMDVTMIEPEVLNPLAMPKDPLLEQQELEEKIEEAKKQEEDPDHRGQVVEIAPPDVEVRPDDADFVSEYDQKVEHQTKGPSGKPVGAARPQPAAPAQPKPPTARPQPPTQAPPAPGSRGAGSLAMRSPRTGTGSQAKPAETPGGSPDGMPVDQDGIGMKRGDGGEPTEAAAEPQGGGDGNPLPRMQDLRPSQEQVARAVGGGSSDYLPDIDEGAQTLVNTKRWKYASFFNRVKRAVAQNWHPDVAYRLRDPNGQIYGQKSRLTVLKVSLKPDGTIRDILIEKPCGVDFLDDEAVKAFREAQPFPNPPAGLVNQDSKLITFRFGFFFEISEGSSWKVFRYNN